MDRGFLGFTNSNPGKNKSVAEQIFDKQDSKSNIFLYYVEYNNFLIKFIKSYFLYHFCNQINSIIIKFYGEILKK